MGKGRAYKSGTNWCFWRWTEVPTDYILRLHVVKTPWWAICIHWINKPDPEPYLHDHPVSFHSFILKGWYREARRTEEQTIWGDRYNGNASMFYRSGLPKRIIRKWHNYIQASESDCHTIIEVSPGGCVTLCFMGPKVREWGFHTPLGWEYWKDYNKRVYS